VSTTNNDSGNPVSGFDALIGQDQQVRQLMEALRKGNVPHAMLFTGEDGIGKRTAAVIFAMACLCEARRTYPGRDNTNPCGACRSCRNILSGNHPDVHQVQPSGAHIRIDQVRALCRGLTLKPYEASVRVVLISDAHLMNAESGNALLKVLEEPPADTKIILTAPRTDDLLPTIVSRCRHLRFNPISRNRLETYLMENRGVDPENALIIATLAGGSIGRALSIQDDDWVHRRNWIIDEIECIGQQPGIRSFAFTEKLASNKERLGYAFEIMKSWIRDLAIFKFSPGKIINRDLIPRIAAASDRFTPDLLVSQAAAVEDAERAIAGNANVRLALDALVLKLANH